MSRQGMYDAMSACELSEAIMPALRWLNSQNHDEHRHQRIIMCLPHVAKGKSSFRGGYLSLSLSLPLYLSLKTQHTALTNVRTLVQMRE